ncbi:hypothetical protein [Aquimarina mytili]|uniref:Uncharacterized protein n=1 Tax=Aquimarina mytili TaxID=874423 RepID=A0A937DBG1_9FLAO|nr:hypothetical protein [Aquimarina mytili]MBL0683786.1 hypothetical protein [Aquimarina mytili]
MKSDFTDICTLLNSDKKEQQLQGITLTLKHPKLKKDIQLIEDIIQETFFEQCSKWRAIFKAGATFLSYPEILLLALEDWKLYFPLNEPRGYTSEIHSFQHYTAYADPWYEQGYYDTPDNRVSFRDHFGYFKTAQEKYIERVAGSKKVTSLVTYSGLPSSYANLHGGIDLKKFKKIDMYIQKLENHPKRKKNPYQKLLFSRIVPLQNTWHGKLLASYCIGTSENGDIEAKETYKKLINKVAKSYLVFGIETVICESGGMSLKYGTPNELFAYNQASLVWLLTL